MTDRQMENFQTIEEILSKAAELDEILSRMHYNPENVSEGATEDLEKLSAELGFAIRHAREIAKNCSK